jgi:hypothetical protein
MNAAHARVTLSTCVTLVLSFALTGCLTTTVRSGLPPRDTPKGYDYAWHMGFGLGLIEVNGPYALDRICPAGWAEVRTDADLLDAALTVFTLFIVSSQRVTIVCAEPGAPGPPPRVGYAFASPSSTAYPARHAPGSYPPPPPPPLEP